MACPRPRLRRWEAIRLPLWKASTVVGVERTFTTCCTRVCGTLYQSVRHTVKVPIEGDVVIDVDGGHATTGSYRSSAGNIARAGFSRLRNRLDRDPSRLRKGRSFSRASSSRAT